MKKAITIILFLLSINFGFSQIHTFKTSSVSTSTKNKKNVWDAWSKPLKTSLIIKADGNKHRVVIYSEVIQLFDIIKYELPVETETEIINAYICKDNLGENCVISVVTNKKLDNSKQIYITYENLSIVYNVVYLGQNK